MKRVRSATLLTCLTLLLSSAAFASDEKMPASHVTAAEIVNKNVAARGGLDAWRAVKTISFSGRMEAGGKANVELPFVLEMKRSHKSRVELQVAGQTAVQVYDGSNGWKLRPFLNRHDVEPFTQDEIKKASAQSELDGPLIDYVAKGSRVELVGSEKVGSQDTYKLRLTTREGQTRYIWIDSGNFLEVKVDESPRRLDGKLHQVSTYYDQYRPVEGGLLVPYLFETVVEGVKQTEKIKIETVRVNPALDDSLFTKP